LVEVLEHRNRTEPERAKEKLRRQVRLPHLERDACPPLGRQFADQFAHHLRADAQPAMRTHDGEVQHVQPGPMQFVDHERHNGVGQFGHHADAVALPETAGEVLVGPGELERLALDADHLGHIPADHPADMDAQAAALNRLHVQRSVFRPDAGVPRREKGHGAGEP